MIPISTENVKKFYAAIVNDEKRKQELSDLFRPYQGEVMDEARKILLISREILPLAAQMGFPFTLDELRQYETELNQASGDGELSESELDAVAGGQCENLYCIIIGFDQNGISVGCCIYFGEGACFAKWV